MPIVIQDAKWGNEFTAKNTLREECDSSISSAVTHWAGPDDFLGNAFTLEFCETFLVTGFHVRASTNGAHFDR